MTKVIVSSVLRHEAICQFSGETFLFDDISGSHEA